VVECGQPGCDGPPRPGRRRCHRAVEKSPSLRFGPVCRRLPARGRRVGRRSFNFFSMVTAGGSAGVIPEIPCHRSLDDNFDFRERLAALAGRVEEGAMGAHQAPHRPWSSEGRHRPPFTGCGTAICCAISGRFAPTCSPGSHSRDEQLWAGISSADAVGARPAPQDPRVPGCLMGLRAIPGPLRSRRQRSASARRPVCVILATFAPGSPASGARR